MPNEGKRAGIPDALKDVYGDDRVDDRAWERLREKNPGLSEEELLQKFESESTCDYSSFEREANIRFLAQEIMVKEKDKGWKVLSVGCGEGPEPYELALRLIQSGCTGFSIDGVDVSEKAIATARQHKIQHNMETISGREFFRKMEGAGLLKKLREYQETQPMSGLPVDYEEYMLSDAVGSKLNFRRHDIIDGPFHGRGGYDVVVCNTVLQHYPTWTRELILTNIVPDLRDGGLLLLEHDELLSGRFMSPDRVAWLEPYYQWKKDLTKFGLYPEEIKSDDRLLPMKVWRYRVQENQYKGKIMGIRNRELVELG